MPGLHPFRPPSEKQHPLQKQAHIVGPIGFWAKHLDTLQRMEQIKTCIVLSVILSMFFSLANFYCANPNRSAPYHNAHPACSCAGGCEHVHSGMVAVLPTEARSTKRLLPVLGNFITNLSSKWRFVVHLSPGNEAALLNASFWGDYVACGRISIRPATEVKKYPHDYNKLLLSKNFWQDLPGEHILIFQTDSVLCHASPRKIEDFLQYDYVGAPWAGVPGFNGGLSLRKRSVMLDLLSRANEVKANASQLNEDQWFCKALLQLGAMLPDVETAKRFAVETIYYAQPLGVHNVGTMTAYIGKSQVQKLQQYCPEAMIITDP